MFQRGAKSFAMGAVSYSTRCTAKAKGSKLCYVIYVLSAVGCVMRVLVTWAGKCLRLVVLFVARVPKPWVPGLLVVRVPKPDCLSLVSQDCSSSGCLSQVAS